MISILVVEDEEYARKSLVKKIKEYHAGDKVQVLEAADGEQGFELYCKYNSDLVLTDIKMPGLDGLGLLKKIKERNRDSLVIIVSAHSEFEYAREALKMGAIDYLLKPVNDEKLKDCLDKFYNKNREEKREQLVTGKDMVTRYILKSIRKNEDKDIIGKNMFQKIFTNYQILALYLPQIRILNKEEMLVKLSGVFGEEMWTGFRIVEVDNKIWALCVNMDKEEYFISRKIVRVFAEDDQQIYIGKSSIYSDSTDIGEAYQEAFQYLKYKLFANKQIISKKDIKGKNVEEYYLSNETEDMLKLALDRRNESKFHYMIKQVMMEVKKCGWITMECLELLYSQITVALRRSLKSYLGTRESFELSKTSIIDFNSLDEVETYFLNIGRNICRISSEEENKDVVEVMMEYAKSHLSQEITVKEIAENILFMNSTYVSHLFSKKQGISFSSWVKNLRMEKARELLESTDLSITEVAFLSGYNDTSRFIRVFKSENGMTPNKYKQKRK